MTTDQWEYDICWLNAWRNRSCPPDDILLGPVTPELADHLEICPECRDHRELIGPRDIQQLAAALQEIIPDKTSTPPVPGQIWSLQPQLGNWGPKKRYYNPPMVLVLESRRNDRFCLVAQIHNNANFIGQGDIILPGYPQLQAESWNTYTLRQSDLNRYWGMVELSVVEAIKAESTIVSEINERSLLDLFRQLEVETGFFFSAQAVDDLMDQYNRNENLAEIVNLFDQQPTAEIRDAVRQSHFQPPGDNVISIREYLLQSKASNEILQQAADSGAVIYRCGPLLTLDEQKQPVIKAIHCCYDQPDYDPSDNRMIIVGTFDGLPEAINEEQISLGWVLQDGQLIMEDNFWFDLQENSFKAIFSNVPSRTDVEEGTFSFCIIDNDFVNYD